jgi:phage repressor protein C with HTH and peptisase S24 domain
MKSQKSSGKPKKQSRPLIIRRVEGESMLPSLWPDTYVVGTTRYTLKAGDIVIVDHDGREVIKRVDKIKRDKIYILGDNRTASTDSSNYGWVELESVKAKIIWPKT